MKTLFKIKYWPVVLDVAVILLCVLVTEFNLLVADDEASLVFVVNTSREAFALLPQATSFGQVVALLVIPIHACLFYLAGVMVGTFFVPAIYFAFIKARLQVAADKKLVATEEDLYYFRDTFPGMSAATVSLLIDLEMDPKKDVPASLLQMVGKGLLRMENDGFAPGDASADMSESEEELCRLALDKKGKAFDLPRWKALSIREAKASGYLESAEPEETRRRTTRCWIVAGICFVLFFASGFIMNASGDDFTAFGVVERGISHLGLFFLTPTFTKYVLLGLLSWSILGFFIVSFSLAVYATFFDAKYTKTRSPVRRTKKGKQAARLLYGIKNYIHDFTLLEEATQKHIALWNDFLVYAVVLEENTSIISEIGRYYPSVKLPLLQRVMSRYK